MDCQTLLLKAKVIFQQIQLIILLLVRPQQHLTMVVAVEVAAAVEVAVAWEVAAARGSGGSK